MIAFEESDPESAKWELKLNKEDLKVFIKKGGSALNADLPYVKTQITFNPYFQMEKILASV